MAQAAAALRKVLPVALRGASLNSSSVSCRTFATDSNSTEEKPTRDKLLVIGGSGFVGSAVCEAAVQLGAPQVVSLSRSGLPSALQSLKSAKPWVDQVEWTKGDVFVPEQWGSILSSTSAVVSCVGAFGSSDFMRKVCGEANVIAIQAAADAGVERFVFISAHDFGTLGKIIPAGYYEGKRAAESALKEFFPETGTVLSPGMIYGPRLVGNYQLPLQYVGAPLEAVFSRLPWLEKLPVVGPALVPPVPVTSVGKAAARSAMGQGRTGKLTVWDILKEGS